MQIVEIKALENGGHRNQTIDQMKQIPEGWAVVPESMETRNFPFGEVTVQNIDGIPTVTSWTPGTVPEPEPITESEPTITLQLTKEQYNKLMSLLA